MKKNQDLLSVKIGNRQKILLKMKFTLFFLIAFGFQVSATVYSQATNFNFDIRNEQIAGVLKQIESTSNFRFFFQREQVDVNRTVDLTASNNTVEELLDELFKDQHITYRVLEDNLVLLLPEAYAKSEMQQATITGKVTDSSTGEPLPGVNIVIKGTTTGTNSNTDGNYLLIADRNAILVFSFIGYSSQEVVVGGRSSVDVALASDVTGLEEVVVIGYGTQKKATVTGSVVSTKGEELVKSQTHNLINSLPGILPGVIVNSRTGEPGNENITMYIRGRSTTGNNDPLIIIDGVERGNLELLNSNDIESINVLKDASAAIYGARAANGVILVTTKRGKTEKATINLSYNQGYSQPTRTLKMADSYTFAKVYNEIEVGAGRSPKYTDAELQKYKNGSDPNYPNTDWYDYMTKPLTSQHITNLSVSGGSEKLKYYLSIGEKAQEGQWRHSSIRIQQYSIRSNIDVEITNYFQLGLNLAGRYGKNHYPEIGGQETATQLFLYQPNWMPYWPDTDYLYPCRDGQNIINRVSDASGTRDIDSKALESTLSFRFDLPWIKGLFLDGAASFDVGVDHTKSFNIPNYVYFYDNATDTYVKTLGGRSASQASLAENYDQNTAMTMYAKINYEKSFGVNSINLMAGYEQRKDKYNGLYAFRDKFISSALPQLFAGSSDKNYQDNNGSASEAARMNYFGRATYDYANKYLAQLILRYDGSQNFPKDKRFGFFPGISLGWRLSEEEFMKGLTFINNLKIRASYGEMGNDKVASFQYLTSYGFGNNYVIGNNDVTGLVQAGVPNPNITWEVAKTYNIGLDATLWKNLLGVEFDIFKTRRSNILTKRVAIIPDYTGLLLPDENVGIVENKGFELILSHYYKINTLTYSIKGNISFSRNKVVFSDEQPAAEPYQYATGRPMGSKLLYHALGIFQNQDEIDAHPHHLNTQPGDIKYEDVNKDGEINSLDQIRDNLTVIPEIVYGVNFSFDYKGFDLSLLFQGQANANVLFASDGTDDYFMHMSYGMGNFTSWRAEDHWAPDNATNATKPRASLETWNNNTLNSTFWSFNSGFLRLKNLELGYNLPSSISKKIGIQNLRLYISGQNLAILHDDPDLRKLGYDPETSFWWYYPPQRVYNLGINLTF